MIQIKPRFDLDFDSCVDQSVVKGDPGGVHRAATRRQDARPCDRKPMGADPKPAHLIDVLGIVMVMIAGDVAAVAIGNAANLSAISVPDARAAPVLLHGAFDLITRG